MRFYGFIGQKEALFLEERIEHRYLLLSAVQDVATIEKQKAVLVNNPSDRDLPRSLYHSTAVELVSEIVVVAAQWLGSGLAVKR
jgi:hypothetical protein